MSRLTRRDFCKNMLVLGASASVLPWLTACSSVNKTVMASAYSDKSGNHFVAWFDESGEVFGQVAISQRAHDLVFIKSKQKLLAFARRPGTTIHVIDLKSKKVEKVIMATQNHHFYGHGTVNHDESLLFTTESYFDDALIERDGLVTIRSTEDFAIVRQFSSCGVGPHQLALLSDNKTLVVANGGIHTHPAKGREKLNLDTMRSNLSYIDSAIGKLIEAHKLKDHQLSIRHLCVASDDTVYFGCQYQGPVYQVNPLVYGHSLGGTIKPMQATRKQWMRFHQYTASLAVNKRNELAVTSPRGGVMGIWACDSAKLIALSKLDDGAGVAVTPTQFIATTGYGELFSYNEKLKPIHRHKVRWDNHMITLT